MLLTHKSLSPYCSDPYALVPLPYGHALPADTPPMPVEVSPLPVMLDEPMPETPADVIAAFGCWKHMADGGGACDVITDGR